LKTKAYNYTPEQEHEMLLALFNHSTEGIMLCDEFGNIVLANPKTLELFSYTDKELIGMPIETLIPNRFHKNHTQYRNNYTKQPKSRAMGGNTELFGLTKNKQEIPVEVSLSPFTTLKGNFIMVFIIDITIRKQHQEELKKVTSELHEKNREVLILNEHLEAKVKERTKELANTMKQLAESKNDVLDALEKEKSLNDLKSKFVTTASHEFRTPLGAILSSASLIAKYITTEEQEKRAKHINRIKSSVANLTEILNDFLSLDKVEEGIIRNQPKAFNVKDFIKEIIDEVSPVLKQGQAIQYEARGNQSEALLDKQLLRNVLINLISNAIKYSDEDKTIKVVLGLNNSELIINVIDEGIGIPDEDQKFLFERFFRANNSGNVQGTGLGLNIVKKYVEIMGGIITYKSKVGVGSIFSVKISF